MKPGDLDLFDVDNFSDGFPHDYFAMLRREDPVHWQAPPANRRQGGPMPIDDGFYAITKHADVVEISRRPDVFSSELGGTNLHDPAREDLDNLRQIMLNMDPPKHAKYRRLVARTFTPRAVAGIEPAIRRQAARIVDEIAQAGRCEFVTQLASELPLILICEFLGFPQEDRRRVFDWSNRMIGFDDPDFSAGDVEDRRQASLELYMYANEIAAVKKARPDQSLVSKLINGDVEGVALTEHEFNSFVLLLAVAGNETTRNATSHGMRLLHEHPEQHEVLRSDLERALPTFIEEILRFSPSVIHFRRTTTKDTTLRGIQMPRGTKVAMFYSSANRDDEVFDAPETFDVMRDPNPHLAFGIGEHFCLGASLARMQLRCIFREVISRLPDIRLAEPPKLLRGNFIDGVKEMHVRYTPATQTRPTAGPA